MVDDRLRTYREMRDGSRTPEPMGGPTAPRPGLFMVHLHDASRRHYDLRLEKDGVLWSWAVPKGPSMDPADKRLAIRTEDHPLEYAEFEGVIPPGNYGAGATLVWDWGRWVDIPGDGHGLEHGKLLFDLWGYKLRGRFTLVKTRGDKQWLLIKKPDAYANPRWSPPQTSVLSGLSLAELRDGHDKVEVLVDELRGRGVPERPVDPATVQVMLAETADGPFSDPDWVFELKIDGFRLVAGIGAKGPRLTYRSGRDATATYPEIARVLRHLPWPGLVLDGEVTVLDGRGHPSFQRLQQRAQLRRPRDVAVAEVQRPVTYYAFDCLGVAGFDLRGLPLVERKAILKRVLPDAGVLTYTDHIPEIGEAFFAEVARRGLEGLMAKRADSPYTAGRSSRWLKIPADRVGCFVVVGFSAPKGSRVGLGALHLAVWSAGTLRYAGKVGAGFSDAQLEALRTELEADAVAAPPCEGAPDDRDAVWVAPRIVVEVRFKAWTDSGNVRQPVFQRIVEDVPIEHCVRHGEPGDLPEPEADDDEVPEVRVTNRDKVFWPEDGYTKGDLIAYYTAVAEWILPYLRDRPLVLVRFPDGIHGTSFFQKDASRWAPGWLRTEVVSSEHGGRDIRYVVAESAEALAYIANLGAIPLHVWASRVVAIDRPDWSILDLDPKGAPFANVVRIAREIHDLCVAIGLPVYVKTSGSSGLHCLIPLGGAYTFDQARMLAELVGRVVTARLPDLATMARAIQARHGKVYVDTVQNGRGKLLVAPLSVRAKPGAPVSVPLSWDEVDAGLSITDHTIRTVPARLATVGDPMRAVLSDRPDLGAALERLTALL